MNQSRSNRKTRKQDSGVEKWRKSHRSVRTPTGPPCLTGGSSVFYYKITIFVQNIRLGS